MVFTHIMHVHQTPMRVKSCTHVAGCSPSSCTSAQHMFTKPQRELSRALMLSRAHMLHDVHKTPTQSSHAWMPNAWDGKRSASKYMNSQLPTSHSQQGSKVVNAISDLQSKWKARNLASPPVRHDPFIDNRLVVQGAMVESDLLGSFTWEIIMSRCTH